MPLYIHSSTIGFSFYATRLNFDRTERKNRTVQIFLMFSVFLELLVSTAEKIIRKDARASPYFSMILYTTELCKLTEVV